MPSASAAGRARLLALSMLPLLAAGASEGTGVQGSLLPKISARTWEGWEPSEDFKRAYATWPDRRVPDDIQVWCKGFIPKNATTAVIGGFPTMPIEGPGGLPIPGLLGQCAAIDGRDWSEEAPLTERPTDARFWGRLSLAGGRGAGVTAAANCGYSHNVCCNKKGCSGGKKYGEVTCTQACPDSEMNVLRMGCWPLDDARRGTWEKKGRPCQAVGSVAAAKVYIQGRGGNPCGRVFGVSPPVASWDVGVAVFPTKRKVTITGYVDDAPSYECYARAKDGGHWGPTQTLARVPSRTDLNIAIALMGYSDRPVNPSGHVFDLPLPAGDQETMLV